uniref:Uncharacterized protein n=1 Tax=Candidatus Kentrum sp. SD TaxID=2126332 RepID=A0A450YGB8_9GAMM|nr:MAG: hypothetical protein BECKSD772F_GA0070984_100750 [Candidatus Kentron sp. SD]VFK40588.1 MAG: hypothetical protein BECKSD772E_GA0070983_100749 [Candidatus Kentron sp. SD]VFK80226.1 MAG: hypothetical protein BECKSD772D_GA0070982_109410 [Candidatus Kentron sp. SD]
MGKGEAYAPPSPLPRGGQFPPFTDVPVSGIGRLRPEYPLRGIIHFDVCRLKNKFQPVYTTKQNSIALLPLDHPPVISTNTPLLPLDRRERSLAFGIPPKQKKISPYGRNDRGVVNDNGKEVVEMQRVRRNETFRPRRCWRAENHVKTFARPCRLSRENCIARASQAMHPRPKEYIIASRQADRDRSQRMYWFSKIFPVHPGKTTRERPPRPANRRGTAIIFCLFPAWLYKWIRF